MVKTRCPICRSRRWHRDRGSGQIVCEEGHILQGYVQEDNEAEGVSTHVTRRRRLRKNKIARIGKTADPDLFHGQRLRFLWFQCAQIVLRMQIRALIEIWNLPPEMETIARDLWTMYVSCTDLDAEPFKHVEDQDAAREDDEDDKNGRQRQRTLEEELSDSEEEAQDPTILTDSADEDDEQDGARLGEGADRLDTAEGDPPEGMSARAKRKRKEARPYDPAKKLKLEYTLVICYLACVTLRIPILMKDLIDLAESYRIPYLEVLGLIPEEMRKHLDPVATELGFLDPHVPTMSLPAGVRGRKSFTESVTHMSRMLHRIYGITFPEANAAPILWKCVREAALPPYFYVASRRLLLQLEASLCIDYATRARLGDPPDLTLMSALVICIKLIWGADGFARIPRDENDIASGLPTFKDWLRFAEKMQKDVPVTHLPEGARYDAMANLSGNSIDEYLDYFQSRVLSTSFSKNLVLGTIDPTSGLEGIAERFFPLPLRGITNPAVDRVKEALTTRDEHVARFYGTCQFPTAALAMSSSTTAKTSNTIKDKKASFSNNGRVVQDPVDNEEVQADEEEDADAEPLFTGQNLSIWSSRDKAGGLPDEYVRVVRIASQISGFHPDTIQACVSRMEKSLLSRQQKQHTQQPPPSTRRATATTASTLRASADEWITS